MATKNYAKKQDELDIVKWLESENAGTDLCGDYDYCPMCDKQDEHPCARAFERYAAAKKKEAAKKTAAKTTKTATKSTATKTATAKTTTAKKTTAKKSAK